MKHFIQKTNRITLGLFLLAGMLAVVGTTTVFAAVVETLGQTTPVTSYGSPAFSQTFVPTQTGSITTVTIYPISTANGGVQIYAGAGGGTLLYDQPVSWVGGQPQTIVLTNPVPVTAGQTYTLNPYGTTLGVSCCTTDNYPYGELYIDGASYYSWSGNVADLYFQVVIENTVDSDGDGVNDADDAFPNDPTRAVWCEPGYFGAFSCEPAPAGRYVATAGQLEATACEVGTYQPYSGQITCYLAAPGTFVATTGAIASTLCPVGAFQPLAGSASCNLAPAGSYVSTIGATSATLCPAGTYQDQIGATSCNLAAPGYYVDTIGAVAQTMCPEGYTSDVYGATECYRINTAPTANAGGPYLVAVNVSITLDGSGSTDPEGDALTETWTVAGGMVSGNTFTAGGDAGIYDVCLTVNDGELDSDHSCTIVVVYDPSAGFVTGGGWIISPAGAYAADPSLSGKATFGFVSKYKKGASVPTGNTAFAFDLAGFEFYSDSYEWLVVNQGGTNAQFKGSGRINDGLDPNGNPYKFMIWADDGTPDTFRIKIWWEDSAGEHVVYDNGTDQAIGGGSIVVHKK